MYSVPHFRRDDPAELLALVRACPLAVLVTSEGGRLLASHVPLLHDSEGGPQGRFLGHVARANPQAAESGAVVEAVAVFTGPDAYVSPSSYETKRTDGRVVPTWNYAAVYAFGELRFLDDPAEALGVVSRLTDTHESGRDEPWAVGDAPADYVRKLLEAIRAFEFRVTRMEGKWKLSQNRPLSDRTGVMRDLEARDDAGAAGVLEMMRHLGSGRLAD